MTNDSDPSTPPENINEPTPASAPASSPAGSSTGFSSPMGMVALGGMVLIGTYLVFGLLLNDYWIGWLAVLLAVIAVILTRVDEGFIEKLAPAPVLAKIVGYLLAVLGVLTLIEDLRFADGTLNEFPDVFGALAAYAGYVIAFLGARSIKT